LLLQEIVVAQRPRFIAVIREYDLAPPHWIALQALGEPKPMGELAKQLACDSSNVTWITDRLEEAWRSMGARVMRPDAVGQEDGAREELRVRDPGAPVGLAPEELVDEIAMGAMDLHPIETQASCRRRGSTGVGTQGLHRGGARRAPPLVSRG
jgi:hypothetical protein